MLNILDVVAILQFVLVDEYNEIGDVYNRPSDEKIEAFMKSLKQASFPVTVRWSKGTDIDAGCGQLVTSST